MIDGNQYSASVSAVEMRREARSRRGARQYPVADDSSYTITYYDSNGNVNGYYNDYLGASASGGTDAVPYMPATPAQQQTVSLARFPRAAP